MPLMQGKSKKAFEHNIKAEVHAGKPVKQAVAIAYSEKRHAQHMSEGGEIEMPDEHEKEEQMILDHIALEAMHAIESKDKEAFRHAFHALVADVIHQLSEPMEMKEEG